MPSARTLIGITNCCLNGIAILIFVLILFIGIIYHRQIRDVSLALTYNTCFAALLASLASAVMIASNLTSAFLINNLHFCYAWGLLYDIFLCSIYHSFYLQALYRLCRVIFYKKKSLVSYSLFMTLVVVQWFLTIIVMLPPLLLGWYVRLSTEQYCLVPYTNLGAELYHIFMLQLIPLALIAGTYLWIALFIRQSSRQNTTMLAVNQRQRNLRDLTVIRRIVVLISVLIVLRFPTIVFMIYAMFVGHLYVLTFDIVGLITSMCMIFMGLMLIHITPQLRKSKLTFFIPRDNQVDVQHSTQPVPQLQQQQLTVPPMTTTGLAALSQQAVSPSTRREHVLQGAYAVNPMQN